MFTLTKKKECIRFVEYFNDRLMTLPDLTSSTHLAALFKTHNTQRAVCVDYKIREFKNTATTVKHATTHDQNHRTVHFSCIVLRLW